VSQSVEEREPEAVVRRRKSDRKRRIPPEIARVVRLVVLDVDGVLTDAGVYVGSDAFGGLVELKRFDIQDGIGLRLLRDAGITVAFVSGRVSQSTTLRARELGITELHQDPEAKKLPLVGGIMSRMGLAWHEVAVVADDLPDLPLMRRAGLPVAVRNAVPEVRKEALWTTRKKGGRGAVREFARELLVARGEWDRLAHAYVAERSDA
jgi:3-deoxy-D-manno-octulosonate 8-phosphate phosphatase (KDO 8-P phosphatase)